LNAPSSSRPSLTSPDPASLAQAVLNGERRALAQAITLIESTNPDHRSRADDLLRLLLPRTGGSMRLGVTGIPGVGKSTFIEALGLHVIDQGHRLAVLAIDPSSPRSGGSILGDKTRMEKLSRQENAYVRPTPSGGALGGVAGRSREAMLVCEAAGFDIIIIETVGVGQSEIAVSNLADMFILLLSPGGGDELQGIKKGIVELADLVVVNKADGDLAQAAERASLDYTAALHLLRPTSPNWTPSVVKCSSLTTEGVGDIWKTIEAYKEHMTKLGEIASRRGDKARRWMWDEIGASLMASLHADDAASQLAKRLEEKVAKNEIPPGEAARKILDTFLKD
jgi:LAO/AO transport system kinase